MRPVFAADLPLMRRTLLGAFAFLLLTNGVPVIAYSLGNLSLFHLVVCLTAPVGIMALFGWWNWFVGAAFMLRSNVDKDRKALDLDAAGRFATRWAVAYSLDARVVEARVAVGPDGLRPIVELTGNGQRTLMDPEASLAFAQALSPQGLLAFLLGGAVAIPIAPEESSAHLRLGAQSTIAEARAAAAGATVPLPKVQRALVKVFPGVLPR